MTRTRRIGVLYVVVGVVATAALGLAARQMIVVAVAAVGAIWLVGDVVINWYFSGRSHIGKTRRGEYSAPLAIGEFAVAGGVRAGKPPGVLAVMCRITGTETCEVWEDWVVDGGVRWTTGFHFENCQTNIDSIMCDDGGVGGGGGGGSDPGPGPRQCLNKSRRDYDTGVANCRTVYVAGTIAIVFVGIICTILSGGAGSVTCAQVALAAEAALSAAFAACMMNEQRKKNDRDHDCNLPVVG